MRRADLAALGAVLVAAGLLRAGNLGLLHDRGDQIIWAALATNVAAKGLDGYTVRYVDLGVAPVSSELAYMVFRPGPEETGSVLAGFKRSGEGYWDRPLANQPPVFTYLLVGSHALLGRAEDHFPLLGRAPGGATSEEALARATAHDPPEGARRAQLWATLPVLVSDLLTVALVFLLARRLGGTTRAALVAGAIFAFDPLALYCAHRVLSNATLATGTAATALALLALERDRRWAPLAGLLAGTTCLVKASAVFLLGVPSGWRRPAYWLVGAVVVAPWAWLNWRHLGHPLGLAWQSQDRWLEVSAWARIVTKRGPGYYALVLACSPLVVAGLVRSLGWLLRGATPEERARRSMAAFALIVLLAAQFHSGGKEGRHLLHVYPLLAVAASEWIDRARSRLLVLLVVAPLLVVEARWGLGWAFATGAIPP